MAKKHWTCDKCDKAQWEEQPASRITVRKVDLFRSNIFGVPLGVEVMEVDLCDECFAVVRATIATEASAE